MFQLRRGSRHRMGGRKLSTVSLTSRPAVWAQRRGGERPAYDRPARKSQPRSREYYLRTTANVARLRQRPLVLLGIGVAKLRVLARLYTSAVRTILRDRRGLRKGTPISLSAGACVLRRPRRRAGYHSCRLRSGHLREGVARGPGECAPGMRALAAPATLHGIRRLRRGCRERLDGGSTTPSGVRFPRSLRPPRSPRVGGR